MDAGLDTIEEAFKASMTELEDAASGDVEPAQQPGETQVVAADETPSEEPDEQPAPDADGGDELEQAMLDVEGDNMDTPDPSAAGLTPGTEGYWAQEVSFDAADGPATVTLKELADGYLRQADYTRKTQVVAEEKKSLEEAADFYQRFRTDPAGFARSLAIEAGWLEQGATPIDRRDFASIPTPSDQEASIEAEVQKRLAADPRIERDALAQERAMVEGVFSELETEVGKSISQELRKSLIEEAVQRQNPDLKMIYYARRARALEKQQRASEVRAGAPSRPGAPHSTQQDPSAPVEEIQTIEQAYAQALAEQQAS